MIKLYHVFQICQDNYMKNLGPYRMNESDTIMVTLIADPDSKPYEIIAKNFDPKRHKMATPGRPKTRDPFAAQGNIRKTGAHKNPKAYKRKEGKKVED